MISMVSVQARLLALSIDAYQLSSRAGMLSYWSVFSSPMRCLMRELIVVAFGILFSAIGFVNTFWGNDPYYGLAVLTASFLFYLPLIDVVRARVSAQQGTALLVLLGAFILWSSIGVGELLDKTAMMVEAFPHPQITGY